MLHGKRRIDIMLIVFDVLAVDGRDVTRRPYWERRQLLKDLTLEGDYWSTTPSHTDGEALWEKVCRLGLEGVVAKKRAATISPAGAAGSRQRIAPTGGIRSSSPTHPGVRAERASRNTDIGTCCFSEVHRSAPTAALVRRGHTAG